MDNDALRDELAATLDIMRTIIDSGALKTATNLSDEQKDAIRNELHARIASSRTLLTEIDADTRLLDAAPELLALVRRALGNGAYSSVPGWVADVRALLASIDGEDQR